MCQKGVEKVENVIVYLEGLDYGNMKIFHVQIGEISSFEEKVGFTTVKWKNLTFCIEKWQILWHDLIICNRYKKIENWSVCL